MTLRPFCAAPSPRESSACPGLGRFLAILIVSAALVGCAAALPEEGGRPSVEDFATNSHVKRAIYADLAFKPVVFDVSTRGGVVRLAGLVDREADIAHATRLASAVPGVRSVQNDIRVRQPQ